VLLAYLTAVQYAGFTVRGVTPCASVE
jgi:hypothetical protein